MTTPGNERVGGCLCGGVRYRLTLPLVDAGYCHCRLCQRATGAPVVMWATVPVAEFRYERGSVGVFASSPQYQREFCPQCGTQMVFRAIRDPQTVDVTVGSLDQPESVQPLYHIWIESQVPWLQMGDALPRYADHGPDGA
ncbi:MAG: GFA family protein [Synechococcales cyanobacterium]